MSGSVSDFMPGSYVAQLAVKDAPLNYGTYFFSISLVEDGKDWIDFKERIYQLNIQENDIYKSGQIPSQDQGINFINSEVLIKNYNE
jgi:hypothetical protein